MKYCGVKNVIITLSITLNFNIPLPPPYYREQWVFKSANIDCIQKSINNFDWVRAFENQVYNK